MDKYIKVETVKGIIRQVCFGLCLDEETEKVFIDAIDETVSKSGKEPLIKEQAEWIFNGIKSKMQELYDIAAYNEKKFNGYKIFNDEG